MVYNGVSSHMITRRRLLATVGLGSLALLSVPDRAETTIDLPLPGSPETRPIQNRAMILQRTRPPLLETPWDVFDKRVFTPNDQFYVRWHWAVILTAVDVDTFKPEVRGHVNRTLSLLLRDAIQDFPRVELAAVNQCSGNSRGFFKPRVPGGQ
jgi:DMSO/TMAO reductase YedYZ molybdopterin-dependent catalytic subunit